jgi:hypothetical protein
VKAVKEEKEINSRRVIRYRWFCDNSLLSRILGLKRHEVTGGWRKLYNEELHNLYSSPNIVRMIKSRRMSWVGQVGSMGSREMFAGFWWESQKERDHYEDLYVSGKIIFR